jgi:hypothetical protein
VCTACPGCWSAFIAVAAAAVANRRLLLCARTLRRCGVSLVESSVLAEASDVDSSTAGATQARAPRLASKHNGTYIGALIASSYLLHEEVASSRTHGASHYANKAVGWILASRLPAPQPKLELPGALQWL